jgi:hypothetical protein
MFGSLVSDIIDKPLGWWLFGNSPSSSRIYAHTLLFAMSLTVAAIYLYLRHRKRYLLYVSFGTVTHLILDQMWLNPRTLLWPLYGWSFEKTCSNLGDWLEGLPALPADISHSNVGHWFEMGLTLLTKEPGTYVPEIIGGLVLVALLFNLVRQRRLRSFLRSGHIG